MKIDEVNKKSVQSIEKKELINMHRRTHQLYSIAHKFNRHDRMDILKKAHDIIAQEVKRRKMNHNSPVEKRLYESIEDYI